MFEDFPYGGASGSGTATGSGSGATPTTQGAILGTLENIFTRGLSAYADSQIAKYTGNDPRLYVRDPTTGAVSPQGTGNYGAAVNGTGGISAGVLLLVGAAVLVALVVAK